VFVLRLRRWQDWRRTHRAGRGAGVSPPAFVRPATVIWRGRLPPAAVWPAAALHVGWGGWKRRRSRASAPPPASARPSEDVSGDVGRWCVAAGVCTAGGGDGARRVAPGGGMAGGGYACSGARPATDACTCYCSAAGIAKTGGERFGWGGALVCRRRRLYGRRRRLGEACCRPRRSGRRRLCVFAGAARNGAVHVLLLRHRHWRDRWRTCRAGRGACVSPPACVRPTAAIGRGRLPPASVLSAPAMRVGGGGGKRRRARHTAPPPALDRPAADVSGGEGRWCVAAGVCTAGGGNWARRAATGFSKVGGGNACWRRRRTSETCKCFCCTSGFGKTGTGRVGRGGALVCRRRRVYGRLRRLVEAGCRRRRYGRRPLCVLAWAVGNGDVHGLMRRRRC